MRKKREPVIEPKLPYKFLHCPLMHHLKHTHACVALRAKRVCRENCKDFFEWAKENEPTVQAVVEKHEKSIQSHLASQGLSCDRQGLIQNVMPKGDHICEYCGKAFKVEGRLKGHREKKHKRQIYKAQEVSRRRSGSVGQHGVGEGEQPESGERVRKRALGVPVSGYRVQPHGQ